MLEMLKQISTTPSPSPMNQLETQIYYAFGISGNLTAEGKTLEEVLIQVLEKRGMKHWWNPVKKNLVSDSSLGAIIDALGKIGTKESVKILKKLEKSREGPWSPKLREVLKKIEERRKE